MRKSKLRKKVNESGLTFSGKDLVIALWAIGSIHNRWMISLMMTSSFVTLLTPGTYLSPTRVNQKEKNGKYNSYKTILNFAQR